MKNTFLKSYLLLICFAIASAVCYAQPTVSNKSQNLNANENAISSGGLGGLGSVISDKSAPTKVIPNELPIQVDGATMQDFAGYESACKRGESRYCLAAGKVMMLDKPPQEIFNMSSTTRINRAIRFYEAAISSGDNLEAMELVYDLYYDKNIIERNIHSYTDKERAKELMDAMLAKSYPGGQIRQARDYIEDPEYLLSIGKKKEACAIARSISTKPGISPSTKSIADEMLSGNICSVFSK